MHREKLVGRVRNPPPPRILDGDDDEEVNYICKKQLTPSPAKGGGRTGFFCFVGQAGERTAGRPFG